MISKYVFHNGICIIVIIILLLTSSTVAGQIQDSLSFDDSHPSEESISPDKIKETALSMIPYLLENNMHQQADTAFWLALSSDPSDSTLLYAYAQFLSGQNEYHRALDLFDHYLQRLPESELHIRGELQHRIGIILWEVKEWRLAKKYLEDALTIRKKLAQRDPERYTGAVASTLNGLGLVSSEIDGFWTSRKYYQESLKLYQRLAQKAPDRYTLSVALVLSNMGVASDNYRFVTPLKSVGFAKQKYEEALKVMKNVKEKNAESYKAQLALIQSNLAIVEYKAGNISAGKELFKEALNMRRYLAGQNPDRYNQDVAFTLYRQGNMFRDLGKFKEAQSSYKESLDIYTALVIKFPDVYKSEVAALSFQLGKVLIDNVDFTLAEFYFKNALLYYRPLAKANTLQYSVKLADVMLGLAMVQTSPGNTKATPEQYSDAIKLLQEALTIYIEWAKGYPKKYDPQLMRTHYNIGNIRAAQGEYELAKKAYGNALLAAERVTLRSPDFFRLEIGQILNNLATVLKRNHEPDEALIYYERALAVFRKLAKSVSDPPDRLVAQTLENIGFTHKDKGQLPKAKAALLEALRVRKQIGQRDPQDLKNEKIATLYSDLAAICNELKDIAASKLYLDSALVIFQHLTKSHPDLYQLNVAQTLHDLGDLSSEMNDYVQAEQYYARSLAIRKQLATQYPEMHEVSLAMTLQRIGDLSSQNHLNENAITHYIESLNIYARNTHNDKGQFCLEQITSIQNKIRSLQGK